ncbi:MAG: trigger factor [Acidimicrobiales bacterium]
MKTTIERLEGNRVKLSVEIGEEEFAGAVEEALGHLAHQARLPGFRPGKAPARLVEARLGTEAVREEAMREALPAYYAKALAEVDVDAIADPKLDITSGQASGPLHFDAVVEVRPEVKIEGYERIGVALPSLEVTEEEVQGRLGSIREQFGELRSVERPAEAGDFVAVDVAATAPSGERIEALSVTGYSYRLTAGPGEQGAPPGEGAAAREAEISPEFDGHLLGASPGDELRFEAPVKALSGPISFVVRVKGIREMVLPEATDEWAMESSGFATVAELKDDIRSKLVSSKRMSARAAASDQVVETLASLVAEEAPAPLVQREVDRRLQEMVGELEERGIPLRDYLAATGREPEAFLAGIRAAAVKAVKVDLALRAVVQAEGLELSEEEWRGEVSRMAARHGEPPAAVLAGLETAGGTDLLRSELLQVKALDFVRERSVLETADGRELSFSDLADGAGAEPSAVGAEPSAVGATVPVSGELSGRVAEGPSEGAGPAAGGPQAEQVGGGPTSVEAQA